MRNVIQFIDSISEWTGKIAQWLCVVLLAFMVGAVIMRYVFNANTLWAYEVSLMLGATVYATAIPYVHKHSGHIRVDVFYSRLSPRRKAIIDVFGFLLLFTPLLIVLADVSIEFAGRAWKINEKMYETGWYPPIAPLRTAVAYGICLFALQGLAQFVRDLYQMVRNKPL
ncbi:MAG: TRAP transporter small permease subunit [Dehalococcoidales bacterium]